MFKDIIAPVQAWLLSQGQCPGCGRPLKDGKIKGREDGIKKIFCHCGRVFTYNLRTKKYRRAPWRLE